MGLIDRTLVALALGGLLSGFAADAARRPRDEGAAPGAALSRCLRATATRPPRVSGRTVPAPGIAGDAVHAYRLAAANGPAILYVGSDPKVARCGIAFYGPVTNQSIQALLGLIARVPRLQRQSPDVYPAMAGAAAKRIYWGDPLGPASRGVTMALRGASPGLPTLEIESHGRVAR